jgi:hypothetical protein
MRRWVLVLVTGLAAGISCADDALVLRAAGFVRGVAEITPERIRCQAPDVASAIPDGTFALGLFQTFATPTRFFPDPQNPYANPCGGWLRVESALAAQGLQVDAVVLRYRLRGAGRLRPAVPIQQGFPVACRRLRRVAVAVGLRLDQAGSEADGGAAAGFVPLVPLVGPELIECLQGALAPARTASVALVIRARAAGRADSGQRLTSNPAGYTLTLLVGEEALPDAPPSG